jgi:hypothetical protein
MRRLDVLFGLLAVAGLATAAWTWQRLQVEREHSADLGRQVPAVQARHDQAPAPTPETPAPVVQSAATQSEPVHPAGTTVAYLSAEEAKELAGHRASMQLLQKAAQHERLMMRDPAYRQNRRDDMRQRYAPLRADAIRVGMTPQQADRVLEMEVDRSLRFTDLDVVAGQTPSASMIAEMKRANEAAQNELHQLLGDELLAKWNQYQASGQERSEVSEWRAQLSDPIDEQKAYAVAQSLYVERQRRSNEYEEYVKAAGITDRNTVAPEDRQRWLDLEREANQRTHDAMAGTLSASQLASLDQMLAARLVPIETALRLQLEGKLAKQD